MSTHTPVRRALAFVLIGYTAAANANTWVCTQGNTHRIVANVNPTLPHWECASADGAIKLSSQKLSAECTPVAPASGASCRLVTGDPYMGLRIGMSAQEVVKLYGSPQARFLRESKDGLALVWLYDARPGPHFPIVYRNMHVTGWGAAYLESVSANRVIQTRSGP